MENLKRQIGRLVKITEELSRDYPPKKFTLDGRLVGDIGETIAEKVYKIRLYTVLKTAYDGIIEGTEPEKRVQIKVTMQAKGTINYPFKHPEMLLALKIFKDGSHKELFNGPTKCFNSIMERRKKTVNTNSILIGENELLRLNNTVKDKDRVPKR